MTSYLVDLEKAREVARPEWPKGPGAVDDALNGLDKLPAVIAQEAAAFRAMAERCPRCQKLHAFDTLEWAQKPHSTHQCVDDVFGKGCGATWLDRNVAHDRMRQPAHAALERIQAQLTALPQRRGGPHDAWGGGWNRCRELALTILECEALALRGSGSALGGREVAIRALEGTRWSPSGDLAEWAKTADGKNHAAVMKALDALRGEVGAAGTNRLIAAIRRFTEEAPAGQPSGPTERAIVLLQEATAKEEIDAIRAACSDLCGALARDTQELREAAEAALGGDFRAPATSTQLPSLDSVRFGPSAEEDARAAVEAGERLAAVVKGSAEPERAVDEVATLERVAAHLHRIRIAVQEDIAMRDGVREAENIVSLMLTEARACITITEQERDAARAEVERLKAEVDRLRAQLEPVGKVDAEGLAKQCAQIYMDAEGSTVTAFMGPVVQHVAQAIGRAMLTDGAVDMVLRRLVRDGCTIARRENISDAVRGLLAHALGNVAPVEPAADDRIDEMARECDRQRADEQRRVMLALGDIDSRWGLYNAHPMTADDFVEAARGAAQRLAQSFHASVVGLDDPLTRAALNELDARLKRLVAEVEALRAREGQR